MSHWCTYQVVLEDFATGERWQHQKEPARLCAPDAQIKLFLEGFATGERLQLQKEPARLCAADQIILGRFCHWWALATAERTCSAMSRWCTDQVIFGGFWHGKRYIQLRSFGGKTKPYEENGQNNWYFQCNVEYKNAVIIIIINRLFVCTLINKIHIFIWGVKSYDQWAIRQALDRWWWYNNNNKHIRELWKKNNFWYFTNMAKIMKELYLNILLDCY